MVGGINPEVVSKHANAIMKRFDQQYERQLVLAHMWMAQLLRRHTPSASLIKIISLGRDGMANQTQKLIYISDKALISKTALALW